MVRRVLVGCHSSPFDTHWQRNDIMAKVSELFPLEEVRFETVDASVQRWSGAPVPDHEGDLFGDWTLNGRDQEAPDSKFRFKERMAYDAVFLPDCGGAWYNMLRDFSDSRSQELFDEDLMHIFLRLTSLVKHDGYIFVSKLLGHRDVVAARAPDLLPGVLTYYGTWTPSEWDGATVFMGSDTMYVVFKVSHPMDLHAWFHHGPASASLVNDM
jgi:hypothetical protein